MKTRNLYKLLSSKDLELLVESYKDLRDSFKEIKGYSPNLREVKGLLISRGENDLVSKLLILKDLDSLLKLYSTYFIISSRKGAYYED